MTTLTVELPDEQMEALEHVAQQRGVSVSALIAELAASFATPDGAPAYYDVTQDPIFNIKAPDSAAPADLSLNAGCYLHGAEKQ